MGGWETLNIGGLDKMFGNETINCYIVTSDLLRLCDCDFNQLDLDIL